MVGQVHELPARTAHADLARVGRLSRRRQRQRDRDRRDRQDDNNEFARSEHRLTPQALVDDPVEVT